MAQAWTFDGETGTLKVDYTGTHEERVRQACAGMVQYLEEDPSGIIEIEGAGLFIETGESLEKQKESWSEEDECRDKDFLTAPYWVTTDSGDIPDPYESMRQILDDLAMLWGIERAGTADE